MAIEFIGGVGFYLGAQVPTGTTVGDLALLAYSSDNDDLPNLSDWTIVYTNDDDDPDSGLYYKFIESPTETVDLGDDTDYTAVLVVFRNAEIDTVSTAAIGSSGMPSAPSLSGFTTANGDVSFIVGFLDDDEVTSVYAPSGYTYCASYTGSDNSTTMAAYKVATNTTEDPAPFGGSGSDRWVALQLLLVDTGSRATHTVSDEINVSASSIPALTGSISNEINPSYYQLTEVTFAVTDNTSLSDLFDTVTGRSVTVSDELSISDSFNTITGSSVTVSDELSISDSFDFYLRYIVSDELTLSTSFDTVTGRSVTVSDELSISDSYGVTTGSSVTVSDELSISESFDIAIEATYTVSDELSISESFDIAIEATYTVSDELSISDLPLITVSQGFTDQVSTETIFEHDSAKIAIFEDSVRSSDTPLLSASLCLSTEVLANENLLFSADYALNNTVLLYDSNFTEIVWSFADDLTFTENHVPTVVKTEEDITDIIELFDTYFGYTFSDLVTITEKVSSSVYEVTITDLVATKSVKQTITSEELVKQTITSEELVKQTITSEELVKQTITSEELVKQTIT